jgi:hypothetical protein
MFYRGLKVQALNRHQILSLLIVVLHLYEAIPGAIMRINQQMNSQYEKLNINLKGWTWFYVYIH